MGWVRKSLLAYLTTCPLLKCLLAYLIAKLSKSCTVVTHASLACPPAALQASVWADLGARLSSPLPSLVHGHPKLATAADISMLLRMH